MKRFSELVEGLALSVSPSVDDPVITGITADSRTVARGSLFIAVRGANSDGHDFISSAIAAGCAAVVCDRDMPSLSVPFARVADSYAALAPLARRFFGDPSSRLSICGITGTNGKTTTAFLLRSILESSGRRCAVIGTVGYVIGDEIVEAPNTTPDALLLNELFAKIVAAGIEHVAMEVSSHALKLGRVDGIDFVSGTFTNLTQDHLDFHPDMEDYLLSKMRLFDLARGRGSVNAEDAASERIVEKHPQLIRFGAGGSVTASDVEYRIDGTEFTLGLHGASRRIRTGLVGRPNVSNCLAAAATAAVIGVGADDIFAGLETASAPPGRFELVKNDFGFSVAVDYAHTPDALERLLETGRALKPRTLHVLFGCGGDRDRKKRPIMGAIASRLADKVWVTSDNPRTENPEVILDEVMQGAGVQAARIVDRREAIRRAVSELRAGDILLVAGKGHENYQIIGRKKIHFDDREEVREAMQELGMRHDER